MSAKELVEAATRMKKRGVGGFTSLDDIDLATDYILATVRPDDDEPVTRERLDADSCGMVKRKTHLGTVYFSLPGTLMAYHPEKHQLFLNGGSVELKLKSMGHLRCLVAALGE